MTDHRLGVELSLHNLDLAARAGRDLMVPCSACFQRLRVAEAAMQADPGAWGRQARPAVEVVHLTRFLSRPDVLSRIVARVPRPLTGLKLACYYGCLSLRPPDVTGAPDHENPRGLDTLVRALGADSVRWSHKTECCSSSLSMSRPDIARKLIGDIVSAARRGGARALVTDCPMCQANLESRQMDLAREEDAGSLPVFFISELVAYALSEERLPRRWRKHLVDPRPLLTELGIARDGA
jgi:heterodisulfide reductase subunit B